VLFKYSQPPKDYRYRAAERKNIGSIISEEGTEIMKTLQELAEIREKMKGKVALREGQSDIRIVVGMATCGIAAGARPVLSTLVEEVEKLGLTGKATVTQTGCIGICRLEPIVEVYEPGKEKVTYVKMTAEKARQVVIEHIKGGRPVYEYTIGEK
jgi:NADP-reducing hydrogenase subunit HndB